MGMLEDDLTANPPPMGKRVIPPLDTSTLGPVKIDPNVQREQARCVREAILAAFENESDTAYHAALVLSRSASEQALQKLRRLLK